MDKLRYNPFLSISFWFTILGMKYFVFLLILSNIQYNLEKAGNYEDVENEEEDDDGFTTTKKKDEPVGGKKQSLL